MKRNIFTEVEFERHETNSFDLSHDKKMSLQMGRLVPCMLMETSPGDVFHFSQSQLIRFVPLIAPIMHQINVHTWFFYVPNRIVWENWEPFITGGEDGLDNSVFPYCEIDLSTMSSGCIGDYLGLPVATSGSQTVRVSALPMAMYNMIWNEYFRDQNLQSTPELDQAVDGTNTTLASDYNSDPYRKAWEHDYFTSALPWTQKGPEATIPLGTSAPIEFLDNLFPTTVKTAGGIDWATNAQVLTQGAPGTVTLSDVGGIGLPMHLDVSANHEVNLSSATAAGIIDLRRAFRLQEWLEKNARGGSRYVESMKVHHGVIIPDSRIQRPEFLGGGINPVSISEVLQTSSTDATTPQGNMAGHAIAAGRNNNISYRCLEHGYIIGLMCVMPRTSYFQGIHKHFFKFDKFDYYWKEFAHIGEQAILKKELFVNSSATDIEETFGYIPRYSEYKYIPSTVHGQFRVGSLLDWHMGREFSAMPSLNSDFIAADPTTRIFAVEEGEQVYAHIFNKVQAVRRMPYFGNPKM